MVMDSHLLILAILAIVIWFYHSKQSDSHSKVVELLSENNLLELENHKLKMRVKYLHNYKSDVSKTFQILDNELKIIKKHIPEEQPSTETNRFAQRVSILTPNVLNSLLAQPANRISEPAQEQGGEDTNVFSSMFNSFLTSNLIHSNPNPNAGTTHQQETPQQEEPRRTLQEAAQQSDIPQVSRTMQQSQTTSLQEAMQQHVEPAIMEETLLHPTAITQDQYSKYLIQEKDSSI